MGIISTLKELLGLETREPKRRRDVEVTVERKTDADSERAVKEPVASATASESVAEGGAEASEASETTEAEADATESDADDEGAEAAEDEPEAGDEADADADPVVTIKGIGDAYAERLGAVGIETVADLAAADADDVAAEADVPKARLERWIDRAQDRQ